MKVAGLDVSTTRTGYAAPDGSLHAISPERHLHRCKRLRQITDRLMATIDTHPPLPAVVVIEDYVMGPNGATIARLGELGGVIRLALWEAEIVWVEVAPASLKLFATGSGRADKAHMIAAARELGAPAGIGHDEADAWHLRRMGLVALGQRAARSAFEVQAIADCKALRGLNGGTQ